ncbi:MAG: 50S ribosomal protein L15 [Verrucomicrobiia bacterium]|jgi:large subunit ribosomal protein L15
MRLHNLKPNPGAKHRRKRLGSGEGSGLGKTSGRGHKGQHSRSGSSFRPGFEGGQMPLYRRLPKRGFSNVRHATIYHPINLDTLNLFEDGEVVDGPLITANGLANGKANGGIKVLGRGKLDKKLTVRANAFSKAARVAIEAAGGTCELVGTVRVVAAEPVESN